MCEPRSTGHRPPRRMVWLAWGQGGPPMGYGLEEEILWTFTGLATIFIVFSKTFSHRQIASGQSHAVVGEMNDGCNLIETISKAPVVQRGLAVFRRVHNPRWHSLVLISRLYVGSTYLIVFEWCNGEIEKPRNLKGIAWRALIHLEWALYSITHCVFFVCCRTCVNGHPLHTSRLPAVLSWICSA